MNKITYKLSAKTLKKYVYSYLEGATLLKTNFFLSIFKHFV